jgi:hypothetical protein
LRDLKILEALVAIINEHGGDRRDLGLEVLLPPAVIPALRFAPRGRPRHWGVTPDA